MFVCLLFLKNKVNFFFLFSPLWRFFNLNLKYHFFFFFYIPINPKKERYISINKHGEATSYDQRSFCVYVYKLKRNIYYCHVPVEPHKYSISV